MPKTDVKELKPYAKAGWQLIPLHSHDYFDELKGKRRERGKSPLHTNWTRRPYKSIEQVAHMKSGKNVGVRLRATNLVLDVDPRNFEEGDDPLIRFCDDVGLDLALYPTVETGSGGFHVYMTKPGDVSVRDSLEDYKGLEFKTLGRQVVSAGSIHPTTQRTYEWDFLRPSLEDVIAAPTTMINIIRRPDRSVASGGGEHDQEELAAMLDGLDPEEFRDHDAWFTLMQACHHATAGDGRQEFVEWSTRDPQYSDDGGIIGRRWDSLHADNDGGNRVTYKTLHKVLMDADEGDRIPRRPAADDFEVVGPGDAPDKDLEEHEQKGPVERLNDRYIAVMEGGKFRVMWEEQDPETDGKHWVRAHVRDFTQMYSNRKVQKGKKTVSIAEAWLDWGGRKTAKGVVFDPERDHPGLLNLWTGWGVEPRKGGSWSMLDELLHKVLCDGDDRVYEYALNWAAHMVQHPGSPAEVAVCFQGGKGVGKGTWGRALTSLAGRHGMQITSSEQLTGRFNSHLRDKIVLFADEAIKPFDKDSESRLKGLLTEPRIAYEAKGMDVVSGKNRLHVVMASNEDWFVPASMEGERRFMLQRTNDKRQGQHDWFAQLNAQLAEGGLEALLWDLMRRDVEGWSPRKGVPQTGALVEQRLRSMSPIHQWWFNILVEGELPCETTIEDMDWSFDPARVFKQSLREDFATYCHQNGIRSPGAMGRGMERVFATTLKKLVPALRDKLRDIVPEERIDVKVHGDGRAWCYEFPSLGLCRSEMDQIMGIPMDW